MRARDRLCSSVILHSGIVSDFVLRYSDFLKVIRATRISCDASIMPLSKAEQDGIGAGTILRRKSDGDYECVTDDVVIEEPLEIRIGSNPIATTMRTPGNDEELAAGFLLSEAIVRARADLREIAHCALPTSLGNVLNVTLAPNVTFNPAATQRFGTISSSCGLCGKTSIEFVRQQFPPIDPPQRQIDSATLLAVAATAFAGSGEFRENRRYSRRGHFRSRWQSDRFERRHRPT